jgi:DNA-binding response OmpR family regulator
MDGFETLRVMSLNGIKKPVIVLSALSKQETVIKALQLGVRSYLIKPLKPEDIRKKTTEILRANF